MSTSPSDYDMSDSSYSGASCMTNSPFYQVPTKSPDMPCGTQPFLRIIAQPQNRFRFRYVSELAGTHGCLLSNSAATDDKRLYPSVELLNHTDRALIRCTLVQHNNPNEHPHKLHDEEDRDVSHIVPEHGSYMVGFRGIGIIHTAQQEIKKKCKKMAKGINFNIVRLKFSAHDVQTDREICAPVFSEPIYNLKSAATNDLKIVRMSRFSGSPSGGDDIFIFVEKVNKKHVSICFFELDETGKRIWEGVGRFTPSDVHHQYAIAFRTPAYRDRKSPVDVNVYIELVRTTDGHRSDPVVFKYKAEEFYKHAKRRKTNSASRFNSVPLETVQQNPVTTARDTNEPSVLVFSQPQEDPGYTLQMPGLSSTFSFNEFLYPSSLNEGDNTYGTPETGLSLGTDPLLSSENNAMQTNGEIQLPLAQLDLNDLGPETLQGIDQMDDLSTFANKYLNELQELFSDDILESLESQSSTGLVSDSGNINSEIPLSPKSYGLAEAQGCSEPVLIKTQRAGEKKYVEFNGFYKAVDDIEDKKILGSLVSQSSRGLVSDSSNINIVLCKLSPEDDDLVEAQGCSEPVVVNPQRPAEKKYRLEMKSDEYNPFYKAGDGIEVKKLLGSLESQSSTGLVSDSSKINFECQLSPEDNDLVEAQGCFEPVVVKTQRPGDKKHRLEIKSDEYNAFYKAEVGIEVKKLIKELCGLIKDKKGFKKQEIRRRLELLFDKRLSNGDTFLHMSVYCDPACICSIVKMIDIVKATYLLNYSNDKLQTTLHLTILSNMPQIVSLLISKGADPTLKDDREYNAIHYAVKSGFCLQTLLEAIKKKNVACNINDYNGERQSALHMAVIEDSDQSARLLLQHGASYSVRDEYGRTPLHLAAYDDSLDVTQALLDFIPQSEIDVTDKSGNTALQIVCGGAVRENSVLITRLLLEKKTNPIKTENGNQSAWRLVKNKLALKAVLWDYIPAEFKDDHEIDEEVFLSADEGETSDGITST